MAEKIIMPQLGESIAEGTIVKWLKKPGDAVKKDENIVIISTDKVEAEIPSPASGTLISIAVEPGQTVLVGTVLGLVGQAGEVPIAAAPAPKEEKSASQPVAVPTPVQTPAAAPAPLPPPAMMQTAQDKSLRGFLSPLVRRIAKENGLNEAEVLSINGSGREGRVTKNDLQHYIANRPAIRPSFQNFGAPAPVSYAGKTPQIAFGAGELESKKPVSTMRRVIMENMVASRRTSAHVTTFFEIDYTNVDKVREAHKDRFKHEEGVSLTYTTFITAAACQALKMHPYINAEVRGNEIVFKKSIHLGMAVAITDPEPGLMVPVIRNADQMNLRGLARSINDLATRVRGKKIKPDELSGGTFTITNPGNYGAVIGTPIINQPQVAILGVGNIKKEPVVLEMGGTDVIGIRRMGWLSLSFDHRLIDGATADMFMADLKSILENWSTAP